MLIGYIFNKKILGNIYAYSIMVLKVKKIVKTCWDENRYAHIRGSRFVVLILGAPILICKISGFYLSIQILTDHILS